MLHVPNKQFAIMVNWYNVNGKLYYIVTGTQVQQEAQGLYAEVLGYVIFLILEILFIIFSKMFNFYGFYIALAPRLNIV